MNPAPDTKTTAPHRLDPAQVELLQKFQPNDKLRITQTVRVGAKKWTTVVDGVFRSLAYLATGVTTERVKEDDLVVPVVRFTKSNGELSSIAIDEHTKVEKV